MRGALRRKAFVGYDLRLLEGQRILCWKLEAGDHPKSWKLTIPRGEWVRILSHKNKLQDGHVVVVQQPYDGPISFLMKDPCPCRLREILTVAYMKYVSCLVKTLFACLELA